MNEAGESSGTVILDEKQIYRKTKMEEIEKHSEFLIGISMLFGVLYAFFMYDNPSGITFPLFVVCGYGICGSILKKLEIDVKKESWFIVVISVLLGISTCRTGDILIINMNHLVIFLLACIYLLNNFYKDIYWDFGKYMGSLVLFMGTAISLIKYPIKHSISYVKNIKSRRCRHLVLVGIGFGCSLPLVILLVFLLGQADVVFQNAVDYVLKRYLKPFTMISVIWKILVGTVAFYCLICGAYLRNIAEEITDKRRKEPLIAISGLSVIAMIYIAFCGIQIIYLFLGAGQLPGDISYASYARQGFFQLVFVACLNLVIVLLSLKYFKHSKILNIILAIVSVCTYVMLVSAAYRMLLYIGEYHLTYLRVMVLWFLALLAVLMVGVVIVIFKNRFPLFRYSLVVVSVFYLRFAWMRPDYVIAKYNVNHIEELSTGDISYLMNSLSVDAAPVINEIEMSDKVMLMEGYYDKYIYDYAKWAGWREYNFSLARAEKLIGNF